MESKYKERAVDILNEQFSKNMNRPIHDWKESKENVLTAMCQLAKEVEKETIDQFLGNPGYTWYTKEQVEKLLQKQRELCAEKATFNVSQGDCQEGFFDTNDVYIDKNIILNAKLKID